MHKNFEKNRTKIKGGCQSGRKVVHNNSKSDLPLLPTVRGDNFGGPVGSCIDLSSVILHFLYAVVRTYTACFYDR